jgi:hypothetical protein
MKNLIPSHPALSPVWGERGRVRGLYRSARGLVRWIGNEKPLEKMGAEENGNFCSGPCKA